MLLRLNNHVFDRGLRKKAQRKIMGFAVLVLFAFPHAAAAVEILQCTNALMEASAVPASEQIQLAPGTLVQLRLSPNAKPQGAYFLGQETLNGRLSYIFLARHGLEFIHVSAKELQNRDKVTFDEANWILSPSDQKSSGTCAAHATVACLITHSPELRAAAMRGQVEFENTRADLIAKVIPLLYQRDQAASVEQYEAVQEFLRQNGIDTRAIILNSQQNRDELLQTLRSGNAVYLIYPSIHQYEFRQTITIYHSASDLNPVSTSNNPPSLVTSNTTPMSRHAVLALLAFELGGSTAVVVADSSIGKLRIFWWRDIETASRGEPLIAILPEKEAPKTATARFTEKEIEEMKSRYRTGLADWIVQSPERIQDVANKTDWFEQNAKIGQWVILQKKLNYIGAGESVFSIGRVRQTGRYTNGKAFVTIQPYEYGKFRQDEEETWGDTSISKVELIKPLESTSQAATKFADVLKNGKVGNLVSFRWSKVPSEPEQNLQTVLLEKSDTEISFYDETTGSAIQLGSGDLARDFELHTSSNWIEAEPKLHDALVSVVGKSFESEGYSFRWVGSTSEFKKDLVQAKLVFPNNFATTSFDVTALTPESDVILALNDDRRFAAKIDKTKKLTVLKVRLISVSETKIVFSYYGSHQYVIPTDVKAIFVQKNP